VTGATGKRHSGRQEQAQRQGTESAEPDRAETRQRPSSSSRLWSCVASFGMIEKSCPKNA
jgi:hypothetical protein